MNTSTTNSFLSNRPAFTATSNSKDIFVSLYDNYAAALYGTILSWTNKEEAAQIILQEAFESFMQQYIAGRYNELRPFIALLRLARQRFRHSVEEFSSSDATLHLAVNRA